MKTLSKISCFNLIKNDFSLDIFIHSSNVADIATKIADKLQLSNEEKLELLDEALYHDIGKSRIPESILYKEGKLTSEEWEIMKRHTDYSESLYLSIVNHKNNSNIRKAKTIRHHHENWDGTGYPDNLKGQNIPLHSRIIRIADVFDAITQPRVYRPFRVNNPLEIMEEMQEKEIDPFVFNECYDVLVNLLSFISL